RMLAQPRERCYANRANALVGPATISSAIFTPAVALFPSGNVGLTVIGRLGGTLVECNTGPEISLKLECRNAAPRAQRFQTRRSRAAEESWIRCNSDFDTRAGNRSEFRRLYRRQRRPL